MKDKIIYQELVKILKRSFPNKSMYNFNIDINFNFITIKTVYARSRILYNKLKTEDLILELLYELVPHCIYYLGGKVRNKKEKTIEVYAALIKSAIELNIISKEYVIVSNSYKEATSVKQRILNEEIYPESKEKITRFIIRVSNSYDIKDILKNNQFFYNSNTKTWEKQTFIQSVKSEILWLSNITSFKNIEIIPYNAFNSIVTRVNYYHNKVKTYYINNKNLIPDINETEKLQSLINVLCKNDEYKILEPYDGKNRKVKFLHKKCGNVAYIYPEDFLTGIRCPCEYDSHNEEKIGSYLTTMGIKYTQQYVFNDLVSDKGYPLRFDFAILGKQDELICLIEFDGEGHFKPIEEFGGEAAFQRTRLHDELKNSYCQKNNIPLYRIRTGQDVHYILNTIIQKHKGL